MFREYAIGLPLLLMTSCAVAPRVADQPVFNSTKGYATLVAEVSSVNTIDDDDLPKAKQELMEDLMTKVKTATSFRLPDDPSKADLKVLIVIKDLRYVSGGHRFWMGAAAGHATLAADVKLTDTKTGSILWTLSVDTTTSAWSGIFAADSSSELETLADQILKGIKDNT